MDHPRNAPQGLRDHPAAPELSYDRRFAPAPDPDSARSAASSILFAPRDGSPCRGALGCGPSSEAPPGERSPGRRVAGKHSAAPARVAILRAQHSTAQHSTDTRYSAVAPGRRPRTRTTRADPGAADPRRRNRPARTRRRHRGRWVGGSWVGAALARAGSRVRWVTHAPERRCLPWADIGHPWIVMYGGRQWAGVSGSVRRGRRVKHSAVGACR